LGTTTNGKLASELDGYYHRQLQDDLNPNLWHHIRQYVWAKVLEINMGDTHKQLHKLWTLEANGGPLDDMKGSPKTF